MTNANNSIKSEFEDRPKTVSVILALTPWTFSARAATLRTREFFLTSKLVIRRDHTHGIVNKIKDQVEIETNADAPCCAAATSRFQTKHEEIHSIKNHKADQIIINILHAYNSQLFSSSVASKWTKQWRHLSMPSRHFFNSGKAPQREVYLRPRPFLTH